MTALDEHERRLTFETLCSLLRHDVRNKVASARMAAHWLKKKGAAAGLGSEPRFDQFHTLLEGELVGIDAMLTERLPHTGAATTISRAKLAAIAERALSGLPRAGIDVAVDATDDEVMAIVDDVACALRALLRNAFEASNNQGRVRVRAFVEGDDAIFEVSDDGPGVPAEVRARAEHGFTSTKGQAGLGLAVAARVARAQQGELLISADPPTRVALKFPR